MVVAVEEEVPEEDNFISFKYIYDLLKRIIYFHTKEILKEDKYIYNIYL